MNNHLKYSAILLFLFYCCFVSYAQVETRHLGQNEEKDYWEEKNLELATTCRNIPIKALPVFDINKIIEEDADRDNLTGSALAFPPTARLYMRKTHSSH